MRHEVGRRRLAIACLIVALVAWNLRFDAGVRASVRELIQAREAWAAGRGPEVPLAAHMRAGRRRAAREASLLALPLLGVGAVLLVSSRRRLPRPGRRRDQDHHDRQDRQDHREHQSR